MENDNNKILTYYEVQTMLPDYAFNRLTEEEKKNFEKSITSYPDLQKELEDVKTVFRKVEQTDFEGKFARKTRNLSVDVINKYQKKKSAYSFQNLTKYLVPTLGVFIIVLLVWKGDILFQSKNVSSHLHQIENDSQTKDLISFHNSDLSVILDTLVTEDEYLFAAGSMVSSVVNDNSKNSYFGNSNLEDALTELYSDEVLDRIIPILGNEIIKTEVDFYHILNEINHIEFNDLQIIIEELKNVEIPS